MKEFGSDFHYIDNCFLPDRLLPQYYTNATLFANGRQCLIALILAFKWERIWIPEYFCYEVIDVIQKTGVEIKFYVDYPGCDDCKSIETIDFHPRDVLLRVNYFGLRNFRDEEKISIPVIEDHTHDLLSEWALKSNATWCIASLRKSLPIAEGGILWSPQGQKMELNLESTADNQVLSADRWKSMQLKLQYLSGGNVDKNRYRELQIRTENAFDKLELSSIDPYSLSYLNKFDIVTWYKRKSDNWNFLFKNLGDKFTVISSPHMQHPFSFIVLAKDTLERERIKRNLILKDIYPAILWCVPNDCCDNVKNISERILCIHCDGRYTITDMKEMCNRIKSNL